MTTASETSLLAEARAFENELVEIRRDLHMHPELGFQEVRTSGVVERELQRLGIETRRVAQTGVLGVLRGAGGGRTVGLRADMDALPITEQSDVPYASQNQGVMHACGHDAHTTCLLGAARLLSRRRGDLAGTVKFFFQPAEEGPGGAAPMIAEGVMDDPKVDGVFGLHVAGDLPVGQIGVRSGPSSAAADEIVLDIIGESGHAAHPHRAVDAIVAASHTVLALQTLVSRELNPTELMVVTIGTIQGGVKRNVIAERVRLNGTVRTFNPELRRSVPERVERVVKGVTEALRARYELDYRFGYPPLINEPAATGLVRRVAAGLLGPEAVYETPQPTMGAEDFAYFLERAPGCFFRLGTRRPDGPVIGGHTPTFDIDERALPIGAATLAGAALEFLDRGLE